jgi:hypothetical protein
VVIFLKLFPLPIFFTWNATYTSKMSEKIFFLQETYSTGFKLKMISVALGFIYLTIISQCLDDINTFDHETMIRLHLELVVEIWEIQSLIAGL